MSDEAETIDKFERVTRCLTRIFPIGKARFLLLLTDNFSDFLLALLVLPESAFFFEASTIRKTQVPASAYIVSQAPIAPDIAPKVLPIEKSDS